MLSRSLKSTKTKLTFIEIITNAAISEDIVHESGVCQNCFIKFNEYDEHLTIAEQIQSELLELMDSKLYSSEEEAESKIKIEQVEELEEVEESSTGDPIEYEPEGDSIEYDAGEVFLQDEDDESGMAVETIQEEYNFEIVVDDDTKENIKSKQPRASLKTRVKDESTEFIIIEMDDNSRAYQCDICFKTFKDRSKLRTHREIHTTQRNVICPVSQSNS